MIGTLYVHIADVRRFLLVARDRSFPASRFDQSRWRVVVAGAEAFTASAAMALRQDGNHEYREPVTH